MWCSGLETKTDIKNRINVHETTYNILAVKRRTNTLKRTHIVQIHVKGHMCSLYARLCLYE